MNDHSSYLCKYLNHVAISIVAFEALYNTNSQIYMNERINYCINYYYYIISLNNYIIINSKYIMLIT